MTEMDQTNNMSGAGETAGLPSELEKTQIICVIGKASSNLPICLPYPANRRPSGGPGVGKGTQCMRLATDLCVSHLSVGDVLRQGGSKILEK